MEEDNTKGKMSSTWWIVIAIAAIIVIVLVVKYAMIAPEESATTNTQQQQQQQQQAVTAEEGKMLAGLTCVDGKSLTASFTNRAGKTLDLSKDVQLYINDALDKTPGCDKTILNAGESTLCTGLDVVKPGYKASVLVKIGFDKEVATVICG